MSRERSPSSGRTAKCTQDRDGKNKGFKHTHTRFIYATDQYFAIGFLSVHFFGDRILQDQFSSLFFSSFPEESFTRIVLASPVPEEWHRPRQSCKSVSASDLYHA